LVRVYSHKNWTSVCLKEITICTTLITIKLEHISFYPLRLHIKLNEEHIFSLWHVRTKVMLILEILVYEHKVYCWQVSYSKRSSSKLFSPTHTKDILLHLPKYLIVHLIWQIYCKHSRVKFSTLLQRCPVISKAASSSEPRHIWNWQISV